MPRCSIRGGMQCAPLPVRYSRIPNELTVVMVTIPSDNGAMTREQLIKALEHATFYGTWEDACKAQAALDNYKEPL